MRFWKIRSRGSPLPPAAGLPYVVIGGHHFPIVSIRLVKGETVITYELRGPLSAMEGNITVFGDDGVGCWQGKYVKFPDIPSGATWSCYYGLRLTEILSEDESADFT